MGGNDGRGRKDGGNRSDGRGRRDVCVWKNEERGKDGETRKVKGRSGEV